MEIGLPSLGTLAKTKNEILIFFSSMHVHTHAHTNTHTHTHLQTCIHLSIHPAYGYMSNAFVNP